MSQSQVFNNPSSCEAFNNKPIYQTSSFKCYLRMPDMRSIIQNISTECSVLEVKQKAKQLFNLSHVNNPAQIRLIVNQVELLDGMDLNEHLFHNAIVHVIVPSKHHSQQQQQQQITSITLRIKQPPVNCPILTIPSIQLTQTIKSLKSKILEFYRSQHSQNEISQLKENQLYLVYGGRVLMDQKIIEEYSIDENGVVYVVNGRLYVKEVTRQEAERRVNQVKGRLANKNREAVQKQPQNQQQNLDSEIRPQQAADTVEFNIIQNIVHDSDSQVQGQAADGLSRSQKIIQRYNSLSQSNPIQDKQKNNNVQSKGLDIEEVEQKPFVECLDSQQNQNQDKEDQEDQEGFVISGKGNSFKMIDVVVVDEKELSWQQKITVDNYLDFVNQQVADYQATRQQYGTPLAVEQQDQPIIINEKGDDQTNQQQQQQQQLQKQQQQQQSTPFPTQNDQSYESNNDQMLI